MRPYIITDSALVAAPATQLFEAMTDFAQFPQWWPKHYKTQVIASPSTLHGREAWLNPAPGLTIGWKIREANPPHSFTLDYSQGWHTGHGIWTFTPEANQTRITYHINITPKNSIYAFMYRLVNLRKRHSHDIQLIMGLLTQYLQLPAPTDFQSQRH